MKRLSRIIIRSLTVLSLLLCLATCVLWVRSYFVETVVGWKTWNESADLPRYIQFSASTHHGVTVLLRSSETGMRSLDSNGHPELYPPDGLGISLNPDLRSRVDPSRSENSGFWDRLGFSAGAFESQFASNRLEHRWLAGPVWPFVLLLSILPAGVASAALRQRHRKKRCLCPGCGYDLRATPERCSECGAVPAAKAIA